MLNPEIKSSRGATSLLLLGAALLMALALPLRIWQQIYLVESETGFWAVDSERVTIILLYVAMGALVALPFVTGLVLRRQFVADLTRRPRMVEAVAAIAVAVGITVGAALSLNFALSVFSGQMVEGLALQVDETMMQYYIRSGAMAALLEAVFGVLSALFFVSLAIVDLQPAKQRYLNRFLALTPVLWVIFRVLRRFSRTIAYLRVSDLFITIMGLVLLMLFLLAFAQVLSGVNGAGREWRLAAAGIPAAALLLLAFIPRIVASQFVSGLVPSQDAVIEWADPAMALFIVIFLFGRLRTQNPAIEAPEAEDAEEPEEASSEELQTVEVEVEEV